MEAYIATNHGFSCFARACAEGVEVLRGMKTRAQGILMAHSDE